MGRQGVTWAGKIAAGYLPGYSGTAFPLRCARAFLQPVEPMEKPQPIICSAAALEAEGQKVICNHTGSNMLNGVVAAFVLAAKWNGKIDADYACIEADEASTRHIFPRIKPDYMLLTNLFRDQLDRYGEIDITMKILEEMMQKIPDHEDHCQW